MNLSKQTKIGFWFYVTCVIAFEIGLLILVHYFLQHHLGVTLVRATVLVVIIALFFGVPTFKGLRAAYRIRFRGDSMDEWMDRLGQGIIRSLGFWFWFTSPLLIFVFSFIYSIPLVLLASIISLPFGEPVARNLTSIVLFCRILSFFFAFGTVLWIWRVMKAKTVRK